MKEQQMKMIVLLAIFLNSSTVHGMLTIDSMTEDEITKEFARCCHSTLNDFTLGQYAQLKNIFGKDCLTAKPETFLSFSETLFISRKNNDYFVRRLVLKELSRHDKKSCVILSKSEKISRNEVIETIKDIYEFYPEGHFFSAIGKGEIKLYKTMIKLHKLVEEKKE